ncbi:Leucine_Rich_repeat_-_putative [Leishmania major strain Friedlin]|nr:Leucine_Rich_repeat_-_putative [Leishmania major strain Friedlin]
MEAETLLRLTVLSFGAAAPQPTHAKHHKDNVAPPTPQIAASQDIRMTFINLWAGQLGQFISVNAFLRETLLFFLPGHWCCGPCETHNLDLPADAAIDTKSLAPRLEQYRTQRAVKQWAINPFFQQLDTLVTELQPKPRHAQPSFQEWLKVVDHLLTALRTLFMTMYSAFFNSFCNVHKTLIDSFRRLAWEDVQTSYALAVCDLSRTIESKLITVVSHAISTNVDACTANTTLQLFRTPDNLTANEVSDYVASALLARLGDVASSVALNARFAKQFPQAATSISVAEDRREESLESLRSSISSYVEKLLAAARTTNLGAPSITEPSAFPSDELSTFSYASKATSTPPLSVEAKRIAQAAQVLPCIPRSVSVEDAFALTTMSEGADVFSSVAAVAASIGDVEGSVRSLVAQQHEEQQAVLGWAPNNKGRQRESWYGADKTSEVTNPGIDDAPALAKKPPAIQEKPVECYRSDPGETALFWNRLRQKLGLDEASVTQARAQCGFRCESPYPNVYLKDLDVRNNDRTTQLFVEEVRPLLSLKDSPTLKARNVRLFREACTSYGKQLWEKTLEIRETLPCLPVRVRGVLLGTMYSAMRADKQFQSLKQIRVQLCQVATKTGGTAKDAATLSNAEEQLLKRAELLAQAVNATENDAVEENRSQAQPTEVTSAQKPECREKAALTSISSETALFKKGLCGSISRYAGAIGSSVSLQTTSARSTDAAWPRSAVMDVLAQSRKSMAELPVQEISPGTPVADVYRQACRCHGVSPNLSVVRELSGSDADYFATLNLSSNYVGVEGLRPVLDLLQYNGEHLISLSVCNNDLESDDVNDLCGILRGPAGTNLVHLDVSYNPFTNATFPALKELVSSLACIETLVMKGTLLSSSASRELQVIVERKMIQRCS